MVRLYLIRGRSLLFSLNKCQHPNISMSIVTHNFFFNKIYIACILDFLGKLNVIFLIRIMVWLDVKMQPNNFLLWFYITDCTKTVTQPTEGSDLSQISSLPSDMVCQISNSCTRIDCCVGASPLSHHFHTYLDIDPCNFKISFGIDKLQFKFNLKDFTFGLMKDIRLFNVVRLR